MKIYQQKTIATRRPRLTPGYGGRMKALLVALALIAGAATPIFAQSEDGIKSAFLYNFGKFTEWPATAFAGASAPITVGFVGSDTLADLFEKNVTGKSANGHDFAVKKLPTAAGVEACQIVIIGDEAQLAAVFAAIKGKSILTVGESAAFGTAGGIIKFYRDGAKVAFDVDLDAAKNVQLKLDSKLLKIAKNVKGG